MDVICVLSLGEWRGAPFLIPMCTCKGTSGRVLVLAAYPPMTYSTTRRRKRLSDW